LRPRAHAPALRQAAARLRPLLRRLAPWLLPRPECVIGATTQVSSATKALHILEGQARVLCSSPPPLHAPCCSMLLHAWHTGGPTHSIQKQASAMQPTDVRAKHIRAKHIRVCLLESVRSFLTAAGKCCLAAALAAAGASVHSSEKLRACLLTSTRTSASAAAKRS